MQDGKIYKNFILKNEQFVWPLQQHKHNACFTHILRGSIKFIFYISRKYFNRLNGSFSYDKIEKIKTIYILIMNVILKSISLSYPHPIVHSAISEQASSVIQCEHFNQAIFSIGFHIRD
jgi:hypothetical protein